MLNTCSSEGLQRRRGLFYISKDEAASRSVLKFVLSKLPNGAGYFSHWDFDT